MSSHHLNEQAGLEVVQEPEAPQVVEQPWHWQKQLDPSKQPYSPYDHGFNGDPPAKTGRSRICGLPKRWFFILLGILCALVVIGLAVGLGVGLGMRKNDSTDSGTSTADAITTSTTSTETRSTATRATETTGTTESTETTATTATTEATSTASSTFSCPSSVYTAPDDTKFNVTCAIDYNSVVKGTVDLKNFDTDTMVVCIDTCANNTMCKGVGYGDNGGGKNTCWMKSALGTPQEAEPKWLFAAKDE
ncbi:hypothetical protein BGZ61DRAFT_521142 [Ilyonectria robusta]|uniref:uncharacterized protein n=1 Tax=Ilyonectria robusta TaxID=1079257 RepID=UPI001E8E5631|nr:uncharacterized protein BGZ61DRAFT_521142 [Ilyonectria robusta]KAH8673071.1 hypothetical protein BGZ61DRAFT_521142 [Ilyonectria robusta]